ncbi:MAG: hypothetical protein QOH49_986 [Acidobacteriota bacterium]|nr:hypothetical protein [Acidobacteriota bacterium]
MITGFNTDIPYDGVTYHVQTEDKGLDTPLILSLVYVGGHIIASKRTPYADLISKGFDEQTLTERLQRQHKLICAAIKSGRVEDLKRMSGPDGGSTQPGREAARKAGSQRRKKAEAYMLASEETAAPAVESAPQLVKEAAPSTEEPRAPEVATTSPLPAPPKAEAIPPPRVQSKAEPDIVILSTLADEMGALGHHRAAPTKKEAAPPPPAPVLKEEAPAPVLVEPLLVAEVFEEPEELSDEIYLSLLDDEGEFRAGQLVTIKIYVGRGTYGQRPVGEANVTVKVLGTSFRPIIVTTTTDEHGVGVVRALLPRFNSGRAAIIIRAVAGDASAEMRRIIHQ